MGNQEGFELNNYCLCKRPYKGEIMLGCLICEEWYHPYCVGIHYKEESDLNKIVFFCEKCKSNNDKEYLECFKKVEEQ